MRRNARTNMKSAVSRKRSHADADVTPSDRPIRRVKTDVSNSATVVSPQAVDGSNPMLSAVEVLLEIKAAALTRGPQRTTGGLKPKVAVATARNRSVPRPNRNLLTTWERQQPRMTFGGLRSNPAASLQIHSHSAFTKVTKKCIRSISDGEDDSRTQPLKRSRTQVNDENKPPVLNANITQSPTKPSIPLYESSSSPQLSHEYSSMNSFSTDWSSLSSQTKSSSHSYLNSRLTYVDYVAMLDPSMVSDYCNMSVIGQGAFGNVLGAWEVSSGRKVAIKIQEKSKYSDQEVKVLSAIQSDHVCKLISSVDSTDNYQVFMKLPLYEKLPEQFDNEQELLRVLRDVLKGLEAITNRKLKFLPFTKTKKFISISKAGKLLLFTQPNI
jgi:hypothetical protein